MLSINLRRCRFLYRAVALLLLVLSSALADELAATFAEASARGDAMEKAPATKQYFSGILMPYFGQAYAQIMQSCFATVPNPDSSAFEFVAAIGADGHTLRVYHNRDTNIFRCVNESLAKQTFPQPPVAPYYLHIAMNFSDDAPAKNAEVKDAPPLVLEPNKYSYTFGVPTGWVFSFDQAREAGVRLMFFPDGGSFNTSNSIIYVNEVDEVCAATCSGMLARALAKTIKESREDSPALQVTAATPIALRTGGSATVRILTGWRDPRQAKEALAFVEHEDAIVLVVLTTKDVRTWEKDYVAFQEIVSGHKFFNCKSPDLATSCH